MSATTAQHPPRLLVLAAFGAVYFIWGSTYLAIRYTVETVPPSFSENSLLKINTALKIATIKTTIGSIYALFMVVPSLFLNYRIG